MRVFVVGMSRAGTTFVIRLLNQHPDVIAFGETAFWGRRWLAPLNDDGSYSTEQRSALVRALTAFHMDGPPTASALYDHELLVQEVSKEIAELKEVSPATAFDALLNVASRLAGRKVAIEKTPHHVHHTSRILASYPDAKFVVLLREPLGFMRSYKNQGRQTDMRVERIFRRLYHPLICALVWRRYMRTIQALIKTDDERFLFISHETIRDKPREVSRRTMAHAGLSPAPDINIDLDRNSSLTDGHHELDPCDLFWMKLICGRLASKQGWRVPPVGFHPLAWSLSAFKLLPWIFRNAHTLRSAADGRLVGYFGRYIRPW